MDRSKYLDGLIEHLKTRKKDKNATVFLDVMCDALVWSDEKVRGLDVNEMGCLRGIFRYRTSLIIQEIDQRFESLWDSLKKKYPDWIGFDPAPCSPDKDLARRYQEMRRKPVI